MPRRIKQTMLVAALYGLLAATSALAQQPRSCTVRSLRGAYGFSIKGQNVAVNVAYILSGRFDADGSGNFSGSGQQSVNGQASMTTFTGTYDVHTDCTGSAQFVYAGGTVADLYFIIVQDGAEVLIMDSDTGTLESGSAKKITLGNDTL